MSEVLTGWLPFYKVSESGILVLFPDGFSSAPLPRECRLPYVGWFLADCLIRLDGGLPEYKAFEAGQFVSLCVAFC